MRLPAGDPVKHCSCQALCGGEDLVQSTVELVVIDQEWPAKRCHVVPEGQWQWKTHSCCQGGGGTGNFDMMSVFIFQQLLDPPPPLPILPNAVYFDHVCYISVTSKSCYVTHFEENRSIANIRKNKLEIWDNCSIFWPNLIVHACI